MLSEACKNAIRAVVYLATIHEQGERRTVHEISAEIEGPEAFVAKVLQELRKHDLVSASKGPNGGMFLTPKQAARPVYDVIRVIDGPAAFTQCGLGLRTCSSRKPCPVHHDYAKLRDTLLLTYRSTSIADLAKGVEGGEMVLKRKN
ncbi:MAG TPA: transcriptional regulator [Bacteroidetes bacterium]|nr:transcriptional regulator [Bacteroidota bacterium]HRK03797.1 Rrf2 family transcriptional regulator [Chlorobiota bacterium]